MQIKRIDYFREISVIRGLTQIGHLDFSAFVLLFLRRFFMCSKGV